MCICFVDIFFTPIKSSPSGTQLIRIERKLTSDVSNDVIEHVAGGRNKGIVINKQLEEGIRV